MPDIDLIQKEYYFKNHTNLFVVPDIDLIQEEYYFKNHTQLFVVVHLTTSLCQSPSNMYHQYDRVSQHYISDVLTKSQILRMLKVDKIQQYKNISMLI